MILQTSFKFRAYPNKEQQRQFNADYGSSKFIWNFVRGVCKRAYKETAQLDENNKYIQGTANIPGINERSKILTELRHNPDYEFMGRGMRCAQQQVLRDFTDALNNFFRNPSENGYPVYKDENDKKSVRYTDSKKPIKLNYIFVAGQGWVKIKNSYFKKLIKQGKEIPEIIPKSITMTCDKAGKFWISVSFEQEFEKLPVTNGAVGIDLGIKTFVYTSDGDKIEYDKQKLNRKRKHLKRYQRGADKCQKDSNRQKKKREHQNKTSIKIKNYIEDAQHKASIALVRNYQVIITEDLAIKQMMKNKRLAKSISEQNWGGFLIKLQYKSTRYGRTLLAIDRFYPSSKLCSCCGHKMDKMELSIRTWTCPKCNTEHERDLNAAINILNKGLMELVPGGTGELTDVDIEKIRGTRDISISPLQAMEESSIRPFNANLPGTTPDRFHSHL